MNSLKLKVKLLEKKLTYKDCASAIGISVTAFNNKVNGTSKFYIEEASVLSEKLELTKDEKIDIFLN